MRPIPMEQMPADLTTRLGPTVQRLGYLGELLAITAHQPAVLNASMDLSAALKQSLGDESVEVLALTVSSLYGNQYERNQHEQLCARRNYPDRWIGECVAAERGPLVNPDPLSAPQRALRNLAFDCLRDHAHSAGRSVAASEQVAGEAVTIAALHAIGYYVSAGIIANALALAAPVPPYLHVVAAGTRSSSSATTASRSLTPGASPPSVNRNHPVTAAAGSPSRHGALTKVEE